MAPPPLSLHVKHSTDRIGSRINTMPSNFLGLNKTNIRKTSNS